MIQDCRLSTICLTAATSGGSISANWGGIAAPSSKMTQAAATGRETGVKSARSLKLDRRSLDWRAADVLREQILTGKLAPGQRVTETALAAQLEVSRGTLRAALRALAHEG